MITTMNDWDASWQHHHIPQWVKVRCRKFLKFKHGRQYINDNYYRFRSSWLVDEVIKERSRNNLFDHIGSIGTGRWRRFVTSPYYGDPDDAQFFAHAIDADLEIINPGIWNSSTVTFIFTPRKTTDEKQTIK